MQFVTKLKLSYTDFGNALLQQLLGNGVLTFLLGLLMRTVDQEIKRKFSISIESNVFLFMGCRIGSSMLVAWLFLRGSITWTLWHKRNDVTLNNVRWIKEELELFLCMGLVDYGTFTWRRTRNACIKYLKKSEILIDEFRERWCVNGVLVTWVDNFF